MRGRGKSKPHVFLTNWASVLCQQFQELLTLDLGPPGLQQRERECPAAQGKLSGGA